MFVQRQFSSDEQLTRLFSIENSVAPHKNSDASHITGLLKNGRQKTALPRLAISSCEQMREDAGVHLSLDFKQ